MEQLDAITEMLTNNPIAGILEDVTANLPPAGFPPSDLPELPIPGVGGGDAPALPFGNLTATAFQNSAGEFAGFVSSNLPDYGTRTAAAIRTTAEAYSDAFQSLAAAFQGLAPMPGEPGMGGDVPGMATAEALAAGFDGLGEAFALSLGDEMDYGAVYAAETIGEALTAAGEDIAAGFATGANVIDALADAIVENAPDAPAPGGDGPEAQLVEALDGGFEQLIAGYNTGAEALSGALPDAIADGIQTVGNSFLEGAMTVTSAIVDQIDGFALPGAGGTGGAPSIPELPAPLADAAAQLQAAFEEGAEQLTGLLGGGAPTAPELPAPLADAAAQLQTAFEEGAEQLTGLLGGGAPTAPELPAPLADAAAQLQTAFEEGAEQLTGLLGGGAPTAPEIPAPLADAAAQLQAAFEEGAEQLTGLLGGGAPTAPEIPAPLADAAAQLQAAFEDGAAQLMDLPGAIQAGITSLASQFPAELPSFPV